MANDKTRRDTLKKIGAALAATAAGAASAEAQVKPTRPIAGMTARQFKVPANVTTAAKQGTFDVYVAHEGADASLLVVPAADAQASQEVARALGGASPAKATVVNGVIHVGLGTAGAARGSVAKNGAIDFRGATVSKTSLIVR